MSGLLILVLACGLAAAAPAGAESVTEPRGTMRQVFEALTTLLPASLSQTSLQEPGARAGFDAAVARLADASHELARHGDSREAGFRFLARSLADDVDDVARDLRAGRLEYARAGVVLLTQRCIECHTRLPSGEAYALGHRLMELPEVAELAAADRALLQVAVRRFGDALATWEALLADPSIPAAAIDGEAILDEYLAVAIRVRREPGRARRALSTFAERPDVPRYLASRLATWQAALAELVAAPDPEPSLSRARAWLSRADETSPWPGSRQGLVFDLAASGELLRLAEATSAFGSSPELGRSLAEIYFLLAVTEERTATPFFLPRTAPYLEAALRADPGGPRARAAYDLLEEALYADLGAASKEDLPPDAQRRLAALATLLEPGGASGSPGDAPRTAP